MQRYAGDAPLGAGGVGVDAGFSVTAAGVDRVVVPSADPDAASGHGQQVQNAEKLRHSFRRRVFHPVYRPLKAAFGGKIPRKTPRAIIGGKALQICHLRREGRVICQRAHGVFVQQKTAFTAFYDKTAFRIRQKPMQRRLGQGFGKGLVPYIEPFQQRYRLRHGGTLRQKPQGQLKGGNIVLAALLREVFAAFDKMQSRDAKPVLIHSIVVQGIAVFHVGRSDDGIVGIKLASVAEREGELPGQQHHVLVIGRFYVQRSAEKTGGGNTGTHRNHSFFISLPAEGKLIINFPSVCAKKQTVEKFREMMYSKENQFCKGSEFMDIIVVGCGKIGITILRSLVAEGHNVTAVDESPAIIAEITNVYDAMGVCGNGVDSETLVEAGAAAADLVVAVTDADEKNMLTCFLAKRMGAKHTIARIRNPEYNDKSLGFLRQHLGLSMALNPELLAAQELYNILKLPSAAKIETFSRRNFEMVELRLKADSPMVGMSLWQLRKKYQANFLVGCVRRGDEVIIPDGSFVLEAGDRIGITAAPTEVQKLLKLMGILQKQARNVMILGASKTAYYLTKMLLAGGNTVKVIDKDPARCAQFSESLPKATVICGDGARQELLLEEGITATDAFVALTGMDEENILISFFAASQNVPKVISKVNRPELAVMAEQLGLDCILSPRNFVSGVLVQYARALQNSMGSSVETLYKLMDEKAEALEFSVRPDFRHVDVPLKELELKQNVLIAGILRGRRAIIPSGDDVLQPDDKVVVLTTGHRLQDLSDIMR